MKFFDYFSKGNVALGVLLLSPALQTWATPVYNYDQEPLAIAHAAVSEVSCVEICLFEKAPKQPCNSDRCRTSCESFTAAYWDDIQNCINKECNTQTSLGKGYVKNMKRAVDNHCELIEELFGSFTPTPTRPTTDDPAHRPRPAPENPKPPCKEDPKNPKTTKCPGKHHDTPPPQRRSIDNEKPRAAQRVRRYDTQN
ncbi:hypothetical protein ABW19_dt0202559 [Dactylella cylindrospora]|nr:hypothetical protein ABW19_dt0202559 [Dactylella cylindrospora]